MDKLFTEYLSLSDKLRNGYQDSLGTSHPEWRKTIAAVLPVVPPIFEAIYGNVEGTYRNISNQKYMDFVPGFRLIHINELESEFHTLLQMLELDDVCESQIKTIIPLLADYSSCYICYAETTDNQELIFYFSPDDGLQKMHNSAEDFFNTIIAFYHNNVYYLDNDGFLDYDFEKEGVIGAEYNSGIEYWTE